MENLTKLNYKGDKVVLTKKAMFMGFTAKGLQFGIPLTYVAWQYGLFSYKNAGYTATGGTIFAAIIIYAFAQNTIKEWVKRNKDELSATYKRSKWVGVWLGAALTVWIGSVFLLALIVLFLAAAGGVASSLWFWKEYDMALNEKDELNEQLSKQVKSDKLDKLKKMRKEKIESKMT